ncbi:hypothetical protein ACFW93_20000 [Streptomyces canus]|uniref:hypothetical protein n=1 Tax=Streptomyces canus TaxID=58343 RepID=UPI00369635E8
MPWPSALSEIRHREMPRDAEERAAMRQLVAEQLGRMERGGRWLPYWLGFMGLVALGAITGSPAFPLVFAVGVAGFCYLVVRMRRRAMDSHHDMCSALRNQGEQVA